MPKEMMKICPTCGTKNNSSSLRCVNCGRILSNVVYPQKSLSSRPSFKVIDDVSDDTQKKSTLKLFMRMFVTLIVFFFIIGSGVWLVSNRHKIGNTGNASNYLGVDKTLDGETIGVNDGSFPPFDINRPTQSLKQQAADALKGGNASAAIALWRQALTINSNDAEALIYIEDQRVLASGEPYMTLVAGVAFTFKTTLPVADGSSESDLQGVYVAQHEFNTAQHGFQIRVLIANSGENVANTTHIAQQIVRIAKSDTTVVGVIGWRYSSCSLLAIRVLANAKIPLISPQSTSDDLTRISSYFFRVVAPNSEEVQVATPFAEKKLGFKHPVIFFDPQDSYSQNIAQDFISQFTKDHHTDISEEPFTTDAKNQPAKFAALIQDAERYQPDGFIFTGRSNIDTQLFQKALPNSGPLAHIQVVAGSGSYNADPNSYGRWYFIAAAYHNASNTPIAQKFNHMYSADFNAYNQKPDGFYGYTLANDHAIVAYDATAVTLQAILNSGKTKPTPQDLTSKLAKITGANAFQGVSGQIAFGSDGNPINKALVILSVSKDGHIQLQSLYGCFIKGCS